MILSTMHMQSITRSLKRLARFAFVLIPYPAAQAEPPATAAPQSGVYDVRSFGAKGDGTTLNTTAIQQTIDTACKDGGGRVVLPPPGVYLTGTILLKDNVTLDIPAGATLLGSRQQSDYSKNVNRFPYITEDMDRVLIYAGKASNISLTGRGTISGNNRNGGMEPLLNPPPGEKPQRAMLACFDECTSVRVDQLTATESFGWAYHFVRCKDVHIDGLSIPNHRQDGIDVESCEDVTISNCNIKAGDDAIVILSNRGIPCRNVTITNCVLASKWGGIRLGPLSYGDIHNIAVSNCIIRDCQGGGIKIGMFEGGEIRDCTFSNITMDKVVAPIVVMLVGNYPQTDNPQHPRMPLGKISRLSFSHITGTAAGELVKEPDAQSIIFLHGHPLQNLDSISLSHIDLTMVGGGSTAHAADRSMVDADSNLITDPGVWPEHRPWGVSPASALHAGHVSGLTLDHLRFTMAKPDARSAVFLQNSNDVRLSSLSVRNPAAECPPRLTLADCQQVLACNCLDHRGGRTFATVEGAKTRGISLLNHSLRGFSNTVLCAPETPGNEVSPR